MTITYKKLIEDSKALGFKIHNLSIDYDYVCGIPNGGIIPAIIIASILKKKIVLPGDIVMPKARILVVDDLIDSGKTLSAFINDCDYDTAVLYRKAHSPETTFHLKEVEGWLELPHEAKSSAEIEDHIARILEFIGENPNREGLKDTPKRVAKMYKEIFRGYDESQKPKITSFENGKDGIMYDQMIIDSGDFYSHCEHHMVPFFGKYYFAYMPDKVIIGLSKVARIIDFYSAKLQIQERLVKEVVDEIEKVCQPRGIALIIKGEHLCKTMRGAKKKGQMITSDLRGEFRNNLDTRSEFLSLIEKL